MQDPRVPLTLLTGFLGAGKSTLLNKILADPGADRIAVIVNEFGEVGLDHDLIETTTEEVILLSSGCICCTIRGDLGKTIPDMMARRAKGELTFDRVVIETTGLADPAPIQRTIITDLDLAKQVYLDGIITLADTVNGPRTLDMQFEAVSQAATADLILLTKTDLASAEQTKAFRSRLRRINASAPIHDVAEAVSKPAMLWGRSGLRRNVSASDALAWVGKAAAPAPLPSAIAVAADPLANLSGLAPKPVAQTFSPHDSRITSASLVLDKPLKRQVLSNWLDTLLDRRGSDILRMKGIVFLEEMTSPLVFHAVQHIFDQPVPLTSWTKGDTTSRIVIIGRDISELELQTSFDALRRG